MCFKKNALIISNIVLELKFHSIFFFVLNSTFNLKFIITKDTKRLLVIGAINLFYILLNTLPN